MASINAANACGENDASDTLNRAHRIGACPGLAIRNWLAPCPLNSRTKLLPRHQSRPAGPSWRPSPINGPKDRKTHQRNRRISTNGSLSHHNPHFVIRRIHLAKQPGITEAAYNTLMERGSDVGALDLTMELPEDKAAREAAEAAALGASKVN